MLVCVTDYLILSFGAGEAFLDDNKFILFYFFLSSNGDLPIYNKILRQIEPWMIKS
ncbi:hypothetical protein AAJ76_3810001319 [Vairimorpha ceranae]|uniref:Uncharacterized protein n=1 Tax=Vairimorpha ceranae TaxID=40302 RepID=A0A0F9WKE4_9MICR|nr:hypothetical protein AAJ76_3810001319 [Vairimorpha ceranae]KKO73618.1 hypothetical protein AAJ76_3810001319 [Vairimorpha ceranae]